MTGTAAGLIFSEPAGAFTKTTENRPVAANLRRLSHPTDLQPLVNLVIVRGPAGRAPRQRVAQGQLRQEKRKNRERGGENIHKMSLHPPELLAREGGFVMARWRLQ